MAKTKSLKSKHTNKDSYELPKHVHKPKSKSKSRRLSISSQSHFNKIPRGPLLSVTFPTQEELDGDDAPPDVPSTEEEFDNRYTSYAKLHVTDAATGEDTFDDLIRVNDCIQIRPGEVGGVSVEDTEKWYGRVLSIGARKEEDRARPDVCLRIAWFYDHAMLQQRTLSAQDRKRCDNMMENELIASDHYDTVNLASVLGRVNILFFNEYTTSQEEIDTEDFFFRREIRNNRVVMAKDTCTARCKMPYSPAREIQHYCDSCRRWYHTSCMVPSKFHQDDYRLIGHSVSSVEQRLLDLIMHPGPRSKKSLAQGKCSFAKKFPSMPIRNASSETEISTDERSDPHPCMIEALALAEKLPSRIRAYATSAITRGVRSGNGIVGNAWVVLNARWLARQAIVEGKHLTQEEEMQIYEAADTMNLRAGVKLTPLAYECQGCGYPI